ncbi:hypothetical protein [Salinisphaera hydrothermalis]|uniref:Glycosyltransferase RgtA/B/C/D-like domain-containing protein n=1 Tax=Salinisphaera hydrothermalis (strain C41B8) TaxID=1304275 RepID=A0A084IKC0_SALHC|nr:hypothetical protein [Salinisphaera hydrothermalis]KEZ77154.1 hypothetical protein C41B8_11213 [Salinisphaera hydrothermalis C41B8]
MTNTARWLGVTTALFGAGLACAAFGLLEVHQFSPRLVDSLMQPDKIVWLYHYTLAHYEINYFQYGFVKRALLSNLFAPFHGQRWVDATLLFNLVVDATLAALAAVFLTRLWRETRWPTAAVFTAATLFGSFGLINLGSDIGRFDFVLLVMLVGSLAWIRQGAVLGPALVTAAALLTHEIYFFIGVPMLIAYTLDRLHDAARLDRRTVWRHLWPLLAVVLAVGIALLLWGRYEPGYQALADRLGRFVFPAAVKVWTRPLEGNVVLVDQYWRHGVYTGFDVVCGAIVWLLLVALIAVLYRARRASALILLTPLAVLPMYALGTDYARWCKLGFALLIVAIAFAASDRRLADGMLDRPLVRLLMLGLVGLPFVPFGIEHAFQMLRP